jgi:phosphatidylglycerophosphate synthase
MSEGTESPNRRPLKSRAFPFFKKMAALLARTGMTPNAISFGSIIFGIAAGAAFASTADCEGLWQRLNFVAAAVCIQLRLICNLLDGMVAIEHQRRSPTGDLWNEVPDRISDAATLLGAGFAAGSSPWLGVVATVAALLTAYVRALGASVGAGQIFDGPGAKPQRMAIMTIAAVLAAIFGSRGVWFAGALGVATLLAIATVAIRLRKVSAFLRNRS